MSETKADYTSGSQQRILKTLIGLSGREDVGISPGELAKKVGSTPSNVTRDLFNLKKAGIAEQIADVDGRWRLGPSMVQIAMAYLASRDRAQSRMNELNNRYSRVL